MDFLRRESVTTSADGISQIRTRFPNWFFEGNTWIGFRGGPNIVERRRGLDAISFKRDITQEVMSDPNETVRFKPVDHPYPYEKCVQRLRQIVAGTAGLSGTNGNPADDRTLLDIVEKKEIPGVSTDD